MNITYFKELLQDVDVDKMCNGIGISRKYLDVIVDMNETIDSTTLLDIMNYLELDLEHKIKLCTFKDDKCIYNFGVNI